MDPVVFVHRRSWAAYWCGIDSRVNDPKDPQASALRGFLKWVIGFFYRGYATSANRVYVSPWCPGDLLAHELAHTPAFGSSVRLLVAPRDPDGGLGHEPLRTRDLMLPGYWSPFRKRDSRDIMGRAMIWIRQGRVLFVDE